ncbi:unnamed protein product [Sphagnum balticum]
MNDVNAGSATMSGRVHAVQKSFSRCFCGSFVLQVSTGLEAFVQSTLSINAASDGPTAVARLDSTYEGLDEQTAKVRLVEFGPNVLSHKSRATWWWILWNAFFHPFNMILLVLAAISGATSDTSTLSIMVVMVVLSVGLRFWQELTSTQAASKLSELVQCRSTVLRRRNSSEPGSEMEINQKDVVPGDIVVLSSGDLIPGDVRLLTSKDMFVSQSSLTGECMPVEKHAELMEEKGTPLLELRNICLMGTNVLSGSGTAVVLSTGDKTYISTISSVLSQRAPVNAFQQGVRRVSYLLICFMLAMVPIVIVLSGLTTKHWGSSLLFGISVAVGLTPEMLPMIVNANLARGAKAMASQKCIVKRLDAIQNLGAMDILCTDKTGTLTNDHVVMIQYLDCHEASSLHVLQFAYLNAFFQTGLKNLLDKAIIEFGDSAVYLGMSNYATLKWEKIDEIPFDFERRRLSVILEEKGPGYDPSNDKKRIMVTKGALEEMLNACSWVQESNDESSLTLLTDDKRTQLLTVGEKLNIDGLRVLVVATKILPLKGFEDFSVISNRKLEFAESDMVFQGFLAFLDPPKDSAKDALRMLAQKSVRVKVMTGDTLAVAVKVCRDVGIPTEHVVTGPELLLMEKEEFNATVLQATILAKLTPTQKLDVIQALKVGAHTVGFLGDGINDAPALKGADVGISVDTATSVAKDAADIILLQRDLNVLVDGVHRGRITHGNSIKYIKMAASSNFGNVFSILIASAWLPFDPMRPIHILTQNLLYDISQISIPWDKMDAHFTEVPHQWSAKGIGMFMVCMGPISSIFDITTFLTMWYYYGCQTDARASEFQTAWFIEGLLTQTLVIHMLRTERIPFFQEIAALPVLILTTIIVGIGIAIPWTPIGKAERMTHLPASYFGFVALFVLSYCILVQFVKFLYIRKFKSWL